MKKPTAKAIRYVILAVETDELSSDLTNLECDDFLGLENMCGVRVVKVAVAQSTDGEAS